MKKLIYLFFPIICLCADNQTSPLQGFPTLETSEKEISYYLTLKDFHTAANRAQVAIKVYPSSESLQKLLIIALAEQGNESLALKNYQAFWKNRQDRELLEKLSWGILKKHTSARQLQTKLFSLIGVALTNDAKAIPIIINFLHDEEALFRRVAIQMACFYGDDVLKDEIAKLVKEETTWQVKLEAIKAAGVLRIFKLKPFLEKLVLDRNSTLEERAIAISSLTQMYESVDEQTLKRFASSDRVELRKLACRIILNLNQPEHLEILLKLVKDNSPEVKLLALNCLKVDSQNNLEKLLTIIKELSQDTNPKVAIFAAHLALILGEESAAPFLKSYLASSDANLRRFTASLISSCGESGYDIAKEQIKTNKDPYVKAMMAIYLIGQRKDLETAGLVLSSLFETEKTTLWMWKNDEGVTEVLCPSELTHREGIPNYPKFEDQLTKLDILSVLAVIQHKDATETIKKFLKSADWGVCSGAAALLLTEGDLECLNEVKKLLDDPEQEIRVQAALMLALVGKDVSAIKILQEAYPTSSRDTKIMILEALSRIPDPSNIDFFVNLLDDPFQTVRVISASALLQCLYN